MADQDKYKSRCSQNIRNIECLLTKTMINEGLELPGNEGDYSETQILVLKTVIKLMGSSYGLEEADHKGVISLFKEFLNGGSNYFWRMVEYSMRSYVEREMVSDINE